VVQVSHQAQIDFVSSVKAQFPEFFAGGRVLEIGSLNINGSVRDFFVNAEEYVGCDLGEGKGVDIVCAGHELPYADGHFDVAISCECFEHDRHWRKTFSKMVDLVRVGGLVVFSCATTGRREHGTTRTSPADAPFTNDYYMNLEAGHFGLLVKRFSRHEFSENQSPRDLYFWGIK
jgi:SAM-dependent methyltransferase